MTQPASRVTARVAGLRAAAIRRLQRMCAGVGCHAAWRSVGANGSVGAHRSGNAATVLSARLCSAVAALAMVVPASAAFGAELVSVSVARDGKRYVVESVSTYDASQAALIHVLLDYDNFDQVSSVFKEAKYIEPAADGVRRGYTRVEGCIVFFCQTIERIDRIELVDGPVIIATAEPEPDDFRFSQSHWRFEDNADSVTIHYRLEMEPGFWVPPLIGPYVMKKKLVKGATDAMQRVEKRAQAFDAGAY